MDNNFNSHSSNSRVSFNIYFKSSGSISTFPLTSLPLSIHHKDVYRIGHYVLELDAYGLMPDRAGTNPARNLEEGLVFFPENPDGTFSVVH